MDNYTMIHTTGDSGARATLIEVVSEYHEASKLRDFDYDNFLLELCARAKPWIGQYNYAYIGYSAYNFYAGGNNLSHDASQTMYIDDYYVKIVERS